MKEPALFCIKPRPPVDNCLIFVEKSGILGINTTCLPRTCVRVTAVYGRAGLQYPPHVGARLLRSRRCKNRARLIDKPARKSYPQRTPPVRRGRSPRSG